MKRTRPSYKATRPHTDPASSSPTLRDFSGRKAIAEETPRQSASAVAKALALDPDKVHAVMIGQDVHRLSAHRLNDGGRCWLWTCGRCGRRPRYIYIPEGADVSGCGGCLRMTYRCNTRYEWRRDRWTAEQRRIYQALQQAAEE